MGNVKRIYVEKKAPFAAAAKQLQEEIERLVQLFEKEELPIRYQADAMEGSFRRRSKAICRSIPWRLSGCLSATMWRI